MAPSSDIDWLYAAAEQAFFSNDYDTARVHAETVLQAQSEHAAALHLRGLIALEAKEPGGAVH